VADQKRPARRGGRRTAEPVTRGRAAGRAISAARDALSAALRLPGQAGTLALDRARALRRSTLPVLGRTAGRLRQAATGPPPGPFRPGAWRSPLRGRWLTSLLGLVLLAGLPVLAVTGLLSYAAYDPRLPGNDRTPGAPLLKFFLFSWSTHPDWIYRVNQGIHITLGLALLPVLLAKLWSVLPRLFAWPPVESVAHALERLSLLMIVGGAFFEFTTGILNIQNFYVVPSFYTAHLYGAWVFIAGLVVHVTLKFPRMRAGLRSRSLRRELRTPLAETVPESPGPDGLRAADPAPPTISRRGLLAAVGGGSLILVALAAGQSIGGWARRTALLAPRGLSAAQSGALPVNRTAAAAAVTAAETGDSYRLVLAGPRAVRLSREQILALPQHTAVLPIACVEGWSFAASWTGVRLADLARLTGITRPGPAVMESLEKNGAFRRASLSAAQVCDPRSLLALRLNGADLSDDHGYPARAIVPAAPGVHNTKWVSTIMFTEDG
jgi:DMSO/TMAO reductase YedYZ molybdopterin-dependent catalytic subunit